MAAPSRLKRRAEKRARGTIDQLPSGASRVRVYAGRDPITGKRYDATEIIPAGPHAERAAEKALTKLVHQVDERRHPKTNATINQLLDRYLEQSTVARNTKSTYRTNIDKHIRPLIGKLKVGRLDSAILDSFYAELRRCRVHCTSKRRIDHRTPRTHECDERCRPHECRPLDDATVRKIHNILSGAYKKAIRWEWVTNSPTDGAEAPPAGKANPKPPTAEEAARILNQAWQDDPDWGAQIWLTMVIGSRRGETCAIRWRHVDLDSGVLHMEKAIAQDGTETWEKDTKTHQERRIVLDEQTVELLTDHWERCQSRARFLGVELDRDAFVFSPDPDGAVAPKPSSVSQRYGRLVRRLGIATKLHALRHYSATELIAAGVDIRTVAGRLGHGGGGITTLKYYAAWLSEADQRAAQSLVGRMPARPQHVDPVQRAQTHPQAPYERIAAELRTKVLDGELADGTEVPTQKQLTAEYGVSASTAQRALALLKTWGYATESRPGQRARIIAPSEDSAASESVSTDDVGNHSSEPGEQCVLLDLRLLRIGEEVRRFTAEADPGAPDQLRRLLTGAVRRHGAGPADVSDYELEVRRTGSQELLTTYVCF
ncbi:tyrosine-type recombinase/integrase [Haloechinothrix salitolerans]|uniref:Tyrosine-type recombinase/integrase n=1 Tax=Haloechinothrix salitolerans TaxID=926830 RepID=A0ABW2C2P7_9PSEU